MKQHKINLVIIAIMLTITMILSTMSTAWFAPAKKSVNAEELGGEILTQYFHCGSGTAENPFVITRPIHYFNLVNLYQRIDGYSEKNYYFQVGYDKFEGHEGEYLVYDYNNNGEVKVDENGDYIYVNRLNLSYYDGSSDERTILPVGTHDKNFIGTFDGKNIIINGLTVGGTTNEAVLDIGIFGYVGPGGKVQNCYFENIRIDLKNASSVASGVTGNQTHNLDAHMYNGAQVVYVGYLAGHIMANNQFSNVYINDATISGGASAVSGFGYFGCVENEDGTTVKTLGDTISEQFGPGNEAGWGGSMDMRRMYNRLTSIQSSVRYSGNFRYPTAETIIKDRDTGAIVSRYVTATGTTVGSHSGYDLTLRSYKSDVAGSYTFNTDNSGGFFNTGAYIYLTGENEYQQKTLTIYETYEGTDPAYYISDTEKKNFIGLNASQGVINARSTESAAKWMLDASNHLYTYIGATPYYLNQNGNGFSVTTEALTAWVVGYDANGKREIYTVSGSQHYYISYADAWKLITDMTKYNMSDNKGNYLGISGTTVTVTDKAGAASLETLVDGNGTHFWTNDTGSKLYLAYVSGQGLAFSANDFAWTETALEGTKAYSCVADGYTWYIANDNGWKALTNSGKNIFYVYKDIPYYLTADRSMTSITSEAGDIYRSVWQLTDTGADKFTIDMVYNGRVYYLNADIYSRQLSLSDTPMEWGVDSMGKYFIEVNGAAYYLTYNNGWKIEPNTLYNIYTGTHSLSYNDDGRICDTSTSEDQIVWTLDNPAGTGYITVSMDDITYYLTGDASGNLTLQDNRDEIYDNESGELIAPAAKQWTMNDAVGLYYSEGGNQYYLLYRNGWKAIPVYVIFGSEANYLHYSSDGNGGYKIDNSTTKSDLNNRWCYENGAIWMIQNNQRYYLTFKGENEEPTLSLTENHDWVVSSDSIRTADGKFYLNWFVQKVLVNNSPVTSKVWITHTTDTCYYIIDASNVELYLDTDNHQGRTNETRHYQAHWRYDEATHHFYLYYLGQKRFLHANPTGNNFTMALSDVDETTATEWFFDTDMLGSGIYWIPTENYRRYILNDNGYSHQERYYYNFKCGDNYLALSTNSGAYGAVIANRTSANLNSTANWQYYSEGDTPIYQVWGGTVYYLGYENGQLVSTATRTIWHRDANGFYINAGEYISYEAETNRWLLAPPAAAMWITDGSGNYLNVSNGTLANSTDKNNATRWMYSGDATAPGNLYTYVNGALKYLNFSGTSLTLSDTATSWSFSNGTLYTGTNNWMIYNNGWGMTQSPNYYLAYPGTDGLIYMGKTGYSSYVGSQRNKHFDSPYGVTDITKAMEIKFSTVGVYPSGTMRVVSEGAQGSYNTTFNYTGLYFGLTNYSGGKDDAGSLGRSGTVLTISDDEYSWTNNNGKLSARHALSLYQQRYLNYFSSSSINRWYTQDSSPSATYQFIVVHGGIKAESAYEVSRPAVSLGYSGGSKAAATQKLANRQEVTNFAANHEFTEAEIATLNLIVTETNRTSASDRTLNLPSVALSEVSTAISINTVDTKSMAFSDPIIQTNQDSGLATYIPLRIAQQDEDDPDSTYSDYRVDSRNTGYIVSGAHDMGTTSNYRSDIRVARYDTRYIYRAINGSSSRASTFDATRNAALQVITQTASSGGYVRILDKYNQGTTTYNNDLPATQLSVDALGLSKYTSTDPEGYMARDAFYEMLQGGTNIYGLHFMDAEISKDHTIYADQVSILGNTYYNYELPEDCIDFRVRDRGSINFFAGTYFTTAVDCFFSLHQVIRNAYNEITDIKEIRKIYERSTGGYVYLYGDGSVSDGKYNATTIQELKLVFDLSWITNPSSVIQRAVYYFEIPVNSGEYALGSVNGGTGAYLLYLDIGTNGGGAGVEEHISTTGNSVATAFKVDYRTTPDKLPGGMMSLLQFSVNVPKATATEFSINTKFEKGDGSNERCPDGLYIITVTNLMTNPLDLTVFLCDNDDDPNNEYPYAYELRIVNKSNPTPQTMIFNDQQYLKSCYTFTIPPN